MRSALSGPARGEAPVSDPIWGAATGSGVVVTAAYRGVSRIPTRALVGENGNGELATELRRLLRRQWARRPEADAVLVRAGERLLLARAHAPEAEPDRVFLTVADMTSIPGSSRWLPESAQPALAAEGRHLARELHDVVAQRLATLIVHLECDVLEGVASVEKTRQYRDELRGILAAVRNVHRDLRWPAVGSRALIAGVRRQVVPRLEQARCTTRVVVDRWPRSLPPDSCFHVFRLIQEAAANIVRHAQASRAVIRLEGDTNVALVSVSDNGCGFDTELVARSQGATGQSGMGERAQILGGSLRTVSSPGMGTTVALVVPIRG